MVFWRPPKTEPIPKNDVSLRRRILSRDTATSAASDGTYAAKVTCLAEIAAESASWLWRDVIPLGKITTLTGDAGVGKTFLSLNIAASVTRGEISTALPPALETEDDGSEDVPGNVLLISSEADLAGIVGPRLQETGADLLRVQAVRGLKRRNSSAEDQTCWVFDLNEDLRFLELEIAAQMAENQPLRLIIIDPFPVDLFVGPHGVRKLTSMIKHLAEIAAWSQTAILLVANSSSHCQGRSSAILKDLEMSVHSAWTIVRDFEDAGRRLLLPVKSNLTERPSGLSFKFQDGGIVWEPDPVHLTAEQFRAESLERIRNPFHEIEWTELARATDWLKERLKSKVVPLQILKKEAAANDISYRTLRRAFCGLRGISKRIDNTLFWEWRLGDDEIVAQQ